MKSVWRLIPYEVGSGAEQMAADSHLLAQHSQDLELPSILRFYSWLPATISLGCYQQGIPVRWLELASEQGLDVVRRPSGGRAVLHKGDLTYALITRTIAGRRRDNYRYISGFLVDGLAALGVNLSYGRSGRDYIRHPSCFSTATEADLIVADGRKLIGSAQVYRQGSVLQHGAIAITPDYALLQNIFESDVPVVGLRELLAKEHNDLISLLINALTNAASRYFNVEFVYQPFSATELLKINSTASLPV